MKVLGRTDWSNWSALSSYSGSVSEKVNAYMTALGYTKGSVDDKFFNFLRGCGYVGAIDDMLYAFRTRDLTINPPQISLDFTKMTAIPSWLTYTRASTATSLLPTATSAATITSFTSNSPRLIAGTGIVVEPQRTQYLGATATPASQTTGTLPTGTYSLWMIGSGSVAIAAGTATITGTGTATQGTPVNATVTVTGTATITVTGSVDFFQLEGSTASINGVFTQTSAIPNAGAAGTSVTRANDIFTIPTARLPDTSVGFTTLMEFNPVSIGGFVQIFGANQNARVIAIDDAASNSPLLSFYDSTTITVTANRATKNATSKAITGYSSGAKPTVCLNGGTVATAAANVSINASFANTPYGIGMQNNGSNCPGCLIVRKLVIWPGQMSSANMVRYST